MLTEQRVRIELDNLIVAYREVAQAALRVWVAALKVDEGTYYHRVADSALAKLKAVLDKYDVC